MNEKNKSVSLALKNLKKANDNRSFISGLKLGDILLENKQHFLGFEIIKELKNYSSPGFDLNVCLKAFIGEGFSIGIHLAEMKIFHTSRNHLDIFLLVAFLNSFLILLTNFLSFSIKMIVTV